MRTRNFTFTLLALLAAPLLGAFAMMTYPSQPPQMSPPVLFGWTMEPVQVSEKRPWLNPARAALKT